MTERAMIENDAIRLTILVGAIRFA